MEIKKCKPAAIYKEGEERRRERERQRESLDSCAAGCRCICCLNCVEEHGAEVPSALLRWARHSGQSLSID